MADQRRNAEHYMDMTAYEAIQNAEREMGMLPKKGEIWNVEYNGNERTVVVVAAHEEHCTVLLLNEYPKSNKDIKVIGKTVMYTDPAMLAFRYNSTFTSIIKKMPDDEFSDLLGYVADALCIQTDEQTDRVEELEEKLKKARMEVDRLTEQNFRLSKQSKENPTADVAALKAERDVYKTLYEQTIAKLIDGHKGA